MLPLFTALTPPLTSSGPRPIAIASRREHPIQSGQWGRHASAGRKWRGGDRVYVLPHSPWRDVTLPLRGLLRDSPSDCLTWEWDEGDLVWDL